MLFLQTVAHSPLQYNLQSKESKHSDSQNKLTHACTDTHTHTPSPPHTVSRIARRGEILDLKDSLMVDLLGFKNK